MEYKRSTNKNLDEYNPEIDFCSDCKYYGEPNGCNRPNGTCANYDRFLETYNCLNEFKDKIENGTMIELPCKIGSTIFHIVKACDCNSGYKDEYKCAPEFQDMCSHFVEDCDNIYCTCKGDYWPDKIEYCHLNTNVYCENCKSRLCIQKDIFTYDKIDKIYDANKNYNNNYYDVFFTIIEQAEEILEELKNITVELPCNVGDKVYYISATNQICEAIVEPHGSMFYGVVYLDGKPLIGSWFNSRDAGKEFFLTKEQAEAKLKELQDKE